MNNVIDTMPWERRVLKDVDLDIVGSLFGVRFVEEGQVELYVEDDENYHLKASFSRVWLADLKVVVDVANAVEQARVKNLNAQAFSSMQSALKGEL